eukprot:362747-Chlamydomonas_euryale.AAC.1
MSALSPPPVTVTSKLLTLKSESGPIVHTSKQEGRSVSPTVRNCRVLCTPTGSPRFTGPVTGSHSFAAPIFPALDRRFLAVLVFLLLIASYLGRCPVPSAGWLTSQYEHLASGEISIDQGRHEATQRPNATAALAASAVTCAVAVAAAGAAAAAPNTACWSCCCCCSQHCLL